MDGICYKAEVSIFRDRGLGFMKRFLLKIKETVYRPDCRFLQYSDNRVGRETCSDVFVAIGDFQADKHPAKFATLAAIVKQRDIPVGTHVF